MDGRLLTPLDDGSKGCIWLELRSALREGHCRPAFTRFGSHLPE